MATAAAMASMMSIGTLMDDSAALAGGVIEPVRAAAAGVGATAERGVAGAAGAAGAAGVAALGAAALGAAALGAAGAAALGAAGLADGGRVGLNAGCAGA